jgi:type VI secretion system protein ImpC
VADQTLLQVKQDLLRLEPKVQTQLKVLLGLLGEDVVTINKETVDDAILAIDKDLSAGVNRVLYNENFRRLEGVWRSIAELESATDFSKNIVLGMWDVTQEEVNDDISSNVADWTNSELFSVLYTKEYDQHGGSPYGAIIGLFDLAEQDLGFLKGMASICKKSHVPFVGSAAPLAFGKARFDEVVELREIDGELSRDWRMFGKQEESAYVGLTLPRYVVRKPYKDHPLRDIGLKFSEQAGWRTPVDSSLDADELIAEKQKIRDEGYVWGSSAMLFAQNLVRSFRDSGWCQYIRGVDSGGTIANLPRLSRDPLTDELEPPVEAVIPDSLEYSLARAGFIPLVWEKGTDKATFFSAQSMKHARDGSLALNDQDAHYAENDQLTCNLSYTYTICRLAHYLKMMMRGNIGSTADATYVKSQIDSWVSRYVTTVINPDDLTLRYYPFKAYNSVVNKVPGRVGWFDCTLTVQPHIQFEGVDITLKVDARLAD